VSLLNFCLFLRKLLEGFSLFFDVLGILPVIPITGIFFRAALLVIAVLLSNLCLLFSSHGLISTSELSIDNFLSFLARQISSEFGLFYLNTKLDSLFIEVSVHAIEVPLVVQFNVLLSLFSVLFVSPSHQADYFYLMLIVALIV